MARLLKSPELDQLEKLMDVTSLERVLEGLGAICVAKGDHIRHMWGAEDTYLAKQWDRAGLAIDRLREHKAIEYVSVG